MSTSPDPDSSPAPEEPSLRSRLELGRLVTGSLLELGIKAYGAGAVAAVALSDSETVGGKARDAVAAVPSLVEEFRTARYVVDHREEIQEAVDHISANTVPESELREAADEATGTLRAVEETYVDVDDTWTALGDGRLPSAFDHARDAWEGRPDLDSIRQLAEMAETVTPLVERIEVLTPIYYGGIFAVMDNFARDEIVGTVFVMATAFLLALVVGRAVGLWVRRGRPGLIAFVVQQLGVRWFREWYVRNLPLALGPSLHAVARERIHRDVLAEVAAVVDEETYRALSRQLGASYEDDEGVASGRRS
ncbi:hypothetical protein IEQ44_12375 [Nocardioides sp. Y6]|uniref:Uncharacterized protein n=1 Tax=Nocardioides malaquae TaxID=2773426 RepID=A0ABR9RV50_9ACTN|nr:hypothetical protein [Nocardioides malaquae]MBE7325449.1 hypothetical protein [Nocardioides malaquae]